MCIICKDLNRISIGYGIVDLFNMKESIGKDHSTKVAGLLADRLTDEGDEQLTDVQRCMFIRIVKWINDEPMFWEEESKDVIDMFEPLSLSEEK